MGFSSVKQKPHDQQEEEEECEELPRRKAAHIPN